MSYERHSDQPTEIWLDNMRVSEHHHEHLRKLQVWDMINSYIYIVYCQIMINSYIYSGYCQLHGFEEKNQEDKL